MGLFPSILTLTQWASLIPVLSLFTDQVKLYVPTHSSLTFLFFFLAAPGLNCSMWDLQSSLQHTGFFSCSMWDLFPWPGLEPGPPALWVQSLSHWTTKGSPKLDISWCECHLLTIIQSLSSKSMYRDSSHRSFAGDMDSIPGLRRCHKSQGNQAHEPYLLSPHAITRESLHTPVKTQCSQK